ncbi:MAG TPA: alanine--glyoxylate aminotransferase family protein [Vicinamibacterales bacterium]|nr:alanine--glyoxylate aminotransferase family protein [Vicinamibacterales bacterium]
MKNLLPENDRILLGPGPSMTSPRVMRAMSAPTVGHLDPLMVAMLDDVRAKLNKLFRAPEGSFAFAVSGTGTSGMETAVANIVRQGSKATVLINGYFGDRLAQMCERYGATVTKVNGEWGRAFDPSALEKSLASTGADVVAMVHGETSTGVRNPIKELAAIAQKHGALTIVDAVTSLGAVQLEIGAWGVDVCYSCTQKGLGAPSGLAPVVFTPRAMEKAAKCPSFYFDLNLLKDYWIGRKYHHTMSSALVCALYEALNIIEEEGIEARWARHERNQKSFVDGLSKQGLSLLPPASDQLHSLSTVKIPEGVDDAAVRKMLLEEYSIEIGGGLGPFAGKIWRVGLMGNSSNARLVLLLLGALQSALARQKAHA